MPRPQAALRRFVSRCRSSFPLRGVLQLPAKIYRRFFKGRTVPVLGGGEFIAPGGCDLSWISGLGGVRFIALGGCDLSWISCAIHKVFPPFGMVTKCAPGRVDLSPSEPRPLGGKGGGDLSHWCGLPACRGGAIYRAFRLVMVTRPSWPARCGVTTAAGTAERKGWKPVGARLPAAPAGSMRSTIARPWHRQGEPTS